MSHWLLPYDISLPVEANTFQIYSKVTLHDLCSKYNPETLPCMSYNQNTIQKRWIRLELQFELNLFILALHCYKSDKKKSHIFYALFNMILIPIVQSQGIIINSEKFKYWVLNESLSKLRKATVFTYCAIHVDDNSA